MMGEKPGGEKWWIYCLAAKREAGNQSLGRETSCRCHRLPENRSTSSLHAARGGKGGAGPPNHLAPHFSQPDLNLESLRKTTVTAILKPLALHSSVQGSSSH